MRRIRKCLPGKMASCEIKLFGFFDKATGVRETDGPPSRSAAARPIFIRLGSMTSPMNRLFAVMGLILVGLCCIFRGPGGAQGRGPVIILTNPRDGAGAVAWRASLMAKLGQTGRNKTADSNYRVSVYD